MKKLIFFMYFFLITFKTQYSMAVRKDSCPTNIKLSISNPTISKYYANSYVRYFQNLPEEKLDFDLLINSNISGNGQCLYYSNPNHTSSVDHFVFAKIAGSFESQSVKLRLDFKTNVKAEPEYFDISNAVIWSKVDSMSPLCGLQLRPTQRSIFKFANQDADSRSSTVHLGEIDVKMNNPSQIQDGCP